MDNLKLEIKNAGLEKDLEEYLKNKEQEVENDKLQLKLDHMSKINNEYKIESEISSNIMINACEIIQEDFLLIRSLGELDNGTLDKYQKLVKMLQGQRSVKFADDENNVTTNITDENFTFLPLNTTAEDDHNLLESPTMATKKRQNTSELADDDATKKPKNDFAFVRPKAMKSINFEKLTQPVLQPQSEKFDMNATFNLDSGPPPILNERTNSLAPGSRFAPKSKQKFKS